MVKTLDGSLYEISPKKSAGRAQAPSQGGRRARSEDVYHQDLQPGDRGLFWHAPFAVRTFRAATRLQSGEAIPPLQWGASVTRRNEQLSRTITEEGPGT
jgi:hypothetical protein